jgi:hypothetical protein
MANAKRGMEGMLGFYRLGRQHESKGQEMEDLGRLYEAHNVSTGEPSLVLLPGPGTSGAPEEHCTVRVTSHATPPHITVDVVEAPASGDPAALAGMFEVLTRMMERMEWSEEARRHLMRQPKERGKRWAVGAVAVSVAVLVLFLVAAHWRADTERQRGAQHEAGAVAAQESRAPTMVDTVDVEPAVIAYPLPAKPFSDQAKAPCIPRKGEVEINGGCWVALEKRPPCYDDQAEYQGKCYLPVSARSRKPREPQSVQP